MASCKYYAHCVDPLEAEALALRDGITVALEYTAQNVMFQTDRSNLAKAVKEKGLNRSHIGHVVNEIKELLVGERELDICVINRVNNRVADRLAYISRTEDRTDLWLQDAPNALVDLLSEDCNSITD